MKNERRRHPRVTGYAKAVYTPTMAPGYLRNVSAGGCQLAFAQPLQLSRGDTAVVQVIAVHDPDFAPFELRVRVAWVRSDPLWFLMGAEAEPVTETDEQGLRKLLAYFGAGGNETALPVLP